jgi:heptosyltransferase-2
VVVIYGPTVKEFGFFPYGVASRIVERPGLACRPCSAHGPMECPLGHFRCMREIGVEEALSAASDLMRDARAAASGKAFTGEGAETERMERGERGNGKT